MVLETTALTQTMPNSWVSTVRRTLGAVCLTTLLVGWVALSASAEPFTSGPKQAAPQVPGQDTMSTNAAPIGRTRAQEVQVSGDVHLRNGEMQLGNGSTITAADHTIPITLTRGGELRLCATTSVHLSRDRSIEAPDASGLLLALDRGAIEARYTTSKYSDVLLTPDLRILISGPGVADLSIRVSRQGDTCIDNRGPRAPYILVSSQLEGGVYRVQPGQHVSFQHGSLREVVDTETEPCGCPQPVSLAAAGGSGTPAAVPSAAAATQGAPTPSSSKADVEFPLAVSEGLTPAPAEPTTPVAAAGEAHAQVAVPFVYDAHAPVASEGGDVAPAIPPPSPAAPAPVPSNMRNAASPLAPAALPPSAPAAAAVATPPPPPAPAAPPATEAKPRGFFRRVGHFFSRIFGAEPAS